MISNGFQILALRCFNSFKNVRNVIQMACNCNLKKLKNCYHAVLSAVELRLYSTCFIQLVYSASYSASLINQPASFRYQQECTDYFTKKQRDLSILMPLRQSEGCT